MTTDDPASPITDEQRAAAMSALRRAAEDGRLAPAELDQRLDLVHQARLNGQLRAALAGLGSLAGGSAGVDSMWPTGAAPTTNPPSAQPPASMGHNHPAASAHANPTLPSPPGYSPNDRLVLSGGFTDEKRSGNWVIPPYLRVQAGFANVKLDCRHADPAAPIIDVEVGVGAANVVFIVPEGWGVDTDRLGKGMGSIKVKIPRQAQSNQPTLILRGSLGVGSVIVRHENWVEKKFNQG